MQAVLLITAFLSLLVDFYTQPMTAKVDLDAGLGMVVSQEKCYIWAVQKVDQTPLLQE